MIDTNNTDNGLTILQKYFLVLISFFLVISLFFLRNDFQTNQILDDLAKSSLLPEKALSNGKPTIFEFYADWCEACKEMAPDMIELKKQADNKVDLVLLNVENPRWADLIDKYDVNGIPKLIFFDEKGELKGSSTGVRNYIELTGILPILINNLELPSFTELPASSKFVSEINFQQSNLNNIVRSESPRDHS